MTNFTRRGLMSVSTAALFASSVPLSAQTGASARVRFDLSGRSFGLRLTLLAQDAVLATVEALDGGPERVAMLVTPSDLEPGRYRIESANGQRLDLEIGEAGVQIAGSGNPTLVEPRPLNMTPIWFGGNDGTKFIGRLVRGAGRLVSSVVGAVVGAVSSVASMVWNAAVTVFNAVAPIVEFLVVFAAQVVRVTGAYALSLLIAIVNPLNWEEVATDFFMDQVDRAGETLRPYFAEGPNVVYEFFYSAG